MKVYYMNGAGNDFMVMDARDDETRNANTHFLGKFKPRFS